MADRAQNMDGHYAIPKDDLDKLRAAADLLARVWAKCDVSFGAKKQRSD